MILRRVTELLRLVLALKGARVRVMRDNNADLDLDGDPIGVESILWLTRPGSSFLALHRHYQLGWLLVFLRRAVIDLGGQDGNQ